MRWPAKPGTNKCEKLVHNIHSEIIAYYRRRSSVMLCSAYTTDAFACDFVNGAAEHGSVGIIHLLLHDLKREITVTEHFGSSRELNQE